MVSLIERYKLNELERLNQLYDYYLGDTDIKKRTMADPAKPNNQVVNPFSSLIADTVVGYFAGKPISYQSEDKELMIKLQDVFDNNHEHSHNRKLAKHLAIMGLTYELLYLDDESNVNLKTLDPRECFLIYDNTVDENIIAAVRFIEIPNYTDDSTTTKVYVYTEDLVSEYTLEEDELEYVNEELHGFKAVPVIPYRNNDDNTGSFEKVKGLIDAYDIAVSDTENNLEYFADAYLVVTGAEFEDDSEIATMKENRVMMLPDGANAEWLTKGVSDEIEGFKTRLKEDIHSLSQIPNLSDESFSNQSSGEALKYKLTGLENLVSITEGYFKESIEDRIEMITDVFNTKSNTQYDNTSVNVIFTRNLPQNLTNLADIASKLTGIVSDETLFTLLPFVDDPALELERVTNDTYSADLFHEDIEELAETGQE